MWSAARSSRRTGLACSGACLRRQYGDDVVVVVCNGACGDINHLNVNGPQDQSGLRQAGWIGRVLAGEAMRLIEQCVPDDAPVLGCASETVNIPIRAVTPEQLAWARKTLAAAERHAERSKEAFHAAEMGSSNFVEECYAREALAIHEAFPTESEIPVEAQAMRVGRVGIVSNPAELFVEPGLAIKHGSPLQPAFVVGYANGMCGYVPTARAFDEGGYEPRLARSSRLVPEAAEQIVAASLRVLGRVA